MAVGSPPPRCPLLNMCLLRLGLILALFVASLATGVATVAEAQTEGESRAGDRFFSGPITSPDFCLNLSLGGARTYPYDSDGDGMADVCSLPYTRREAVARQNAYEALADRYQSRFIDLVRKACKALASVSFGDNDADLENDVCATGQLSKVPRPLSGNVESFFSGHITGPDFCLNLSLGGARTYPYDSDGDGMADVCSLPYTRREAVARQNAYEVLALNYSASFLVLLDSACETLRDSGETFGELPADLAKDVCAQRIKLPPPPPPPPPPGKPDAPTLQVGVRKLVAEWSEPKNSGPKINDYDVRHCDTSNSNVCDDDDTDWTELDDTGDNATSTATTATITGLTNGTTYEVQVRAGSSAGNGAWSDSATAAVANVPDKPTAPTLTSGIKQLGVSWTEPNTNGEAISDYDVQYRECTATGTTPCNATGDWTDHTHSGTTTTATITGLTNGTTYQVEVRATNGAGTGIWSDPMSAATADFPSKPAAPTLTAGDQQLTASWSPPAANRSTITDYDVRHCDTSNSNVCDDDDTDDTDWTELDDTGDNATSTATITGLTNGTAYQVQVRAGNGVGDGAWSSSATGTAAGEPDKPWVPVLHSGTSTQLLVYWWVPANNGAAIADYDVRYCDDSTGCDAPAEWTALDDTGNNATSTATTVTITGLTDATTYQVQVRAGNSTGDGDWSASAVLAASGTAATVPDKPTGLTVSAASETLTLSWTAPSNNGGSTILGYQFFACWPWARCTLDPPASPRPWPRQTPSEPTCYVAAHSGLYLGSPTSFTGLTNGTNYRLLVRAKNLVGCSDWSDAVFGQPTLGPPTNLVLSAYQDGLKARWTPPSGTVGGYDVQYQACTATPKTCTTNPTWGTWTDHTHSGNAASTTISGLTYGTAYKVRVRAKTSSTQTVWVESSTAVTPAKAAPDAPAAPTLASGNAQLSVKWAAPAYNGGSPITDYDVQYREQNTDNTWPSTWTDHSYTGTGTDTIITSLTNAKNYQVQVRAVNDYNSDNTDDPGDWSLSATETAGRAAQPDAPILTSGIKSLGVEWSPPANNGSAITGYRLRVKRGGPYDWETGTVLSATTTTTTLNRIYGSQLANGRSYDVQVQAQNAAGWSPWSDSASEKVGKPGKIANRTLSLARTLYRESGTAKVGFNAFWLKPQHPSESGFGITGYEMDYRKADATTWIDVSGIQTTNTGGNVTVKPNPSPSTITAYEVRVRAQNAAGYGPWAESLFIVWAPPTAPSNVSLLAGGNSLRATWQPPSDNGGARITGYHAEYWTPARTVNGVNLPARWDRWGYQCVENQHYYFDIDNLRMAESTRMDITNGLTYKVRIRAMNDTVGSIGDDYSPWSSEVSVAAGSGKPYPPYWRYHHNSPNYLFNPPYPRDFPGNYPTVTRGDQQLTVTWSAPNNGGSAITDYDVRYRAGSSGSWTELDDSGNNATSTATTATISNLTNDTAYEVQLRAENSVGSSDWTPSFPGTPSTTAPTTPAAPTDVRVFSGNPRCGSTQSGELSVVDLTLPSDNGGASVRSIQVRYRKAAQDGNQAGSWVNVQERQVSFGGDGSSYPLEAGKKYDVQVRMKNSAGFGAWSQTVTQTTNKPLPPVLMNAAPGDTKIYVDSGTGLANGSTVTGRELRYRTAAVGNTQAGAWTTIRGTGRITTITGLTNGTKYEVQARTTSINGSSGWSSSSFVTPATP